MPKWYNIFTEFVWKVIKLFVTAQETKGLFYWLCFFDFSSSTLNTLLFTKLEWHKFDFYLQTSYYFQKRRPIKCHFLRCPSSDLDQACSRRSTTCRRTSRSRQLATTRTRTTSTTSTRKRRSFLPHQSNDLGWSRKWARTVTPPRSTLPTRCPSCTTTTRRGHLGMTWRRRQVDFWLKMIAEGEEFARGTLARSYTRFQNSHR